MAEIKVAQLPSASKKMSKRELYATIAYYYPQYTLKEVQSLPARDISLLFATARKLEASKFYNLTQIAAAPHSKKGAAVKQLTKHFGDLAKG